MSVNNQESQTSRGPRMSLRELLLAVTIFVLVVSIFRLNS